MYRILGFIGLLFGLGMQFLEARPPIVMVFSQAFQALILPAVAIPVLILINNKMLMGNNRSTRKFNIGIIAVILFSLITSYFAISDFI